MSGFTEAEVLGGLPHLLAEFRERPWIMRPAAAWDSERGRLVVTTHFESENVDCSGIAVLDEVRDCVIASIDFSSEGIHFDLEESNGGAPSSA